MVDMEDILKGIWSIIRKIIIAFILHFVLFYLSFFILKILTFGKYPPRDMSESHAKTILYFGYSLPFIVFFVFFIVNNYINVQPI